MNMVCDNAWVGLGLQRVRFARACPGSQRTVRLSLGRLRNVRYFGRIQRIVTRFGTEEPSAPYIEQRIQDVGK
jgi:hypothetical protein